MEYAVGSRAGGSWAAAASVPPTAGADPASADPASADLASADRHGGGWRRGGRGRRRLRNDEIAGQRMELELDEYRAQARGVGLLHAHRVEVQPQGEIGPNRHQVLRESRLVGVLQQGLARPLFRDLRRVGEDRLEIAIGTDELARRLLPDTGHTGDVVRRVADERQVVRDAVRRDAEPVRPVHDTDPLLLDPGRSAAPRVQEPDTRTHELLKVLVSRHDHDVQVPHHAVTGERPDHVIGFEPLEGEERHVAGLEDVADPLHPAIEIGLQLVAELFPRRLVRREPIRPEGGPGIVHPREVFRMVLRAQTLEKLHDAPGRRGVLAAAGA